MLFNSYSFILFLMVILILHNLPFSWHTKKFNLLLASYIFYAAWNPPFVVLLWISTLVDWGLSRRIHNSGSQRRRKLLLFMSLLVNLGMLGFFKYGNFILDNFIGVVNTLGISYAPARPDIILPIGISFYTFQTISYTFDVYRGKLKPWNSFLDYALYVSFFPQLVAGPIVRAVDFLPQCREEKKSHLDQLGWGLSLLIMGLFSKMVLADLILSPIVENVYKATGQLRFVDAWCGTLAFSLQIFCDFAGYSVCAIGVALCLGFELPDNFRYPYGAVGFTDFWRRWHISLSTWLRDYLYMSLGGNRRGNGRTYVNLMLTMLLGGLWHGASWLFVIWGGIHGFFLAGERWCRSTDFSKMTIWQNKAIQFILATITFIFVSIAWVFFRSSTLLGAYSILKGMSGFNQRIDGLSNILAKREIVAVLVLVPIFLITHWFMRHGNIEKLVGKIHWSVRAIIFGCLTYAVVTSFSAEDRAFIYFQF